MREYKSADCVHEVKYFDERLCFAVPAEFLSCLPPAWTLTHYFFRRVSFRRKKKEDKAAKDAAKEDKAKEKPEKKAVKEEVRSIISAWWIDGIFRQFLGFADIRLRDCIKLNIWFIFFTCQ